MHGMDSTRNRHCEPPVRQHLHARDVVELANIPFPGPIPDSHHAQIAAQQLPPSFVVVGRKDAVEQARREEHPMLAYGWIPAGLRFQSRKKLVHQFALIQRFDH